LPCRRWCDWQRHQPQEQPGTAGSRPTTAQPSCGMARYEESVAGYAEPVGVTRPRGPIVKHTCGPPRANR
jgi:hypothetical protein